jgi:FKBP-type peptidyl-prolyl cis-trans isomerase
MKRLFTIALVVLSSSCRSGPHVYEPEVRPSGLVVHELVVPKGPVAESGDRVTIHYHGTLDDGVVFDSSVERGQPLTFTVGRSEISSVLDEGVTGMHLLGRRRLSAPAERVFPDGLPASIEPNSMLHFEVELLEIEDATQ